MADKWNKYFRITIYLGIIIQILVFLVFPKQAWVEGLLEAWYTSKGLIFYKDFTNQYFPILQMLMVPLHEVFGYNQYSTLFLAPINSLLIFGLLAWGSNKYLKSWVKTIPLIFFLIWNPIVSESHYVTPSFHALLTIIAFFLWIDWLNKPKKILGLFLGLVLGVEIMAMQMTLPFTLLVLLSMFVKSIKERKFNAFVYSVIGYIIPAIFIFIWFYFKNGLYDLYDHNIGYYLGRYPYASMGRDISNILIFAAIFSPVALYVKHIIKSGIDVWQKIISVLAVASLPVTYWLAIFHISRFQMGLPVYAFIFGLGLNCLVAPNKKFKDIGIRLLFILILAINILAFIYSAIPIYKKNILFKQKIQLLTEVYSGDPMFDAVEWIKNNTPKDAKLFVIADPLFYIKTQRLPSHSSGTMNQPFVYEPLDKFKDKIKLRPPDYWVVDERLVNQRFKEFGYEHTTIFFNKLLACEELVARIEYITIRKHNPQKQFCF